MDRHRSEFLRRRADLSGRPCAVGSPNKYAGRSALRKALERFDGEMAERAF